MLTHLMDSLRAWWTGATPATRALAVGMAIVVVVGLAFAGNLATSPDYQPIFHGVSGKDASAIETTLRDHSIAMRFDDKEGTVSVPAKDESNATMYVEAAGILSKDTDIEGIESLDKIGMGTSTDVERKRILVADEGELARKLMRLDPVNTAAVTISPGNSSSLFGSDVAPTASVILGLKSGEALNANQVKGIVNLVAHAVTGLTPANVTLTDQTGAPLWKDNGTGGNALGDGQPLDESAKFAEAERLKLQDLLDATLGPRKAIVTVNAELDFSNTSVDTVEHSAPAGSRTGMPVSVRDQSETYSGAAPAGNGIGGATGSASNLGNPTSYAGGGTGGAGGGSYKKEDTTTNYDNNVTHTVVQKAPGGIKTLSVAALVDSSVQAGDVPKIQTILATAIGAAPGDTTRQVTVQQMTFDTSAAKAQDAQMKTLASQTLYGEIAKAVAACVVAALLLFILMRSGGGGRRATPSLAQAGDGANIGFLEETSDAEMGAILEERPLSIEDVLSEMPDALPAAARRAPRRRTQAPAIEEQQDLKLESIQEMVSTHPELGGPAPERLDGRRVTRRISPLRKTNHNGNAPPTPHQPPKSRRAHGRPRPRRRLVPVSAHEPG